MLWNFLHQYFTHVCNKLECLFPASLSSLVYCLRVRPGAYPREEHVKGTSLKGRLLALPTNIRPGWNALPGTNTLAYYEHSQITDVKVLKLWALILPLQLKNPCTGVTCLGYLGSRDQRHCSSVFSPLISKKSRLLKFCVVLVTSPSS